MFVAGFTFIGAAIGVFRRVEVAKILELVVFLHVVVYRCALPVRSLELAMFEAMFCNLDFAVGFPQLGVYFLLAFRTDAFGFAHINHPRTASKMSASGNSIIDIVTKRSYFRIFCRVELEVNSRADE